MSKTYKGILHFHSETGTEGGYWAFMDEEFMHLDPPNHWWCENCGRIWDKDVITEEPKPSFRYIRPAIERYVEEKRTTYHDRGDRVPH